MGDDHYERDDRDACGRDQQSARHLVLLCESLKGTEEYRREQEIKGLVYVGPDSRQ
jgi:hypothetical protein